MVPLSKSLSAAGNFNSLAFCMAIFLSVGLDVVVPLEITALVTLPEAST